ncbi:MAG TPA: outer membrane beta-barrel protein [Chitinophagaceae bacterium]|jgi:hypothetical protein
MKRISLVITTLASFTLNILNAQTPGAKISGQVSDQDKKPVEGASVMLTTTKDSTTILTGPNGTFVFENLKDNSYQVTISFIGYKNYKSQQLNIVNQKSVRLPAISLVQASDELKEVAVTRQKSFSEQKIDRTVVNVNALISNAGANALEVLEKTPGVQVDADGNITFKGKTNVLVMIDDKPTYLSGANLAAYLRSLPASSLNQIELMDNPPAKYDAAGNAGVINIKTKKNTVRGFNGVFSGNLAQGVYTRTDENLNLNYRMNKVNLFANASYGYNRNFRRLEIDRTYFDANGNPLSGFTGVTYFRPASNNVNLKTGMDYYISPKTTWGIVLNGSLYHSHDSSPVNSYLYSKTGSLDSTILGLTSGKEKFNNGGVNVNYSHKFDSTGTALTFDLDYLRYEQGNNQTFLNDTYQPNGSLSATQLLTDDLPGFVNIYAAKVDFTMPLPGKAKFEAGLKSSYVNTDNAANYFNVVNDTSTVDYDNTNHFLYRENINAAYVNFNKTFQRFSLQTGLRAENTNGHGHQLGNMLHSDSTFSNSYLNLFPTAYFSYKLDTAGNSNLVLSYGRRIGRPNYNSLNPFIFFVDKFSEFAGNPYLKPQFTDIYKLAYSYKSLLTVALSYNYTTNLETETIREENGIFISTQGNIGVSKNLDLSVSSNLPLAKWWTLNLYGELYNNSFSGSLYTTSLNQSGTSFSFNGNSQFTLGHGWSAELSGFYNTRRLYGQFILIPTGLINAGLQKKVMHDKGTIRLNVRDVFHSFTPSGTINDIVGTTAAFHNVLDTQVATIGFTYNFGKTIDNPVKRTTGGADSEKSRVGN